MLSKLIFSARSGTLDLKVWNEWKYGDKTCVMCHKEDENFNHFMTCLVYGPSRMEVLYTDIFGNNHEHQYTVAREKRRRLKMRKTKTAEVGLPHPMAPMLQDTV